jgi:hypothetical protein
MKVVAWRDPEGRAISLPRHGFLDVRTRDQWMAARVEDVPLVRKAVADELLLVLKMALAAGIIDMNGEPELARLAIANAEESL